VRAYSAWTKTIPVASSSSFFNVMASVIIKKVTTKMKEVHGLIYTFSEWEVEGTLNCSGQESEERLSKLQKN